MEDKQPPGEESAMAADQQKPPGEAAMVADQQKPGDAATAAAAARYPVGEVAEAVAFLKELAARLDAFPDVRDGLLDLLVGFGSSGGGGGGGGGDARAVASRAARLLGGHPDVLATFTAFLTGAAKAPAEPLAVARPRRSSTRKSRSLPPPEEPDAQDPRSPPRKYGAGARRDEDDPRVLDALAFLERVDKIAGREVWGRFVEALDGAGSDRGMDAGEVYGGVRGALGPAHGGLLAEFAAWFLPGKQEWAAEERRLARNRRRAAARAAAANHQQQQPRADDSGGGDHRQHGLRGGESSGFQVTLEIVKKRRAGAGAVDGDHHGHDGDNDYAPRVRTKRPRAAADTGGGHRRNAATNSEPSGKNRGAARVVDAGDKKPRRRGAPNGGGGSSGAAPAPPPEPSEDRAALFRRFRELRVFYTRYSTLVGTIARAEHLLLAAAADGAGCGGGGGFPAMVEEMFPRRESREFLASYYGGNWGGMMAALEGGGGGRAGAALKAVLESLRRKEEEAVAEEAKERRRQDAARAAERLGGLVRDRVRHEERRRRRRKDAGDGGACPLR